MNTIKKILIDSPFFQSLLLCLCIIGIQSSTFAQIVSPESWVEIPEENDPMMQNLTIPADAISRGMWSSVFSWPMNGLHSVLLSDGRILTFGTNANGSQQDGRTYDVWDPSLGFGSVSHDTIFDSSRQDSFCAAAIYLADGTMMISGGNGTGDVGTTSTIYDGATHSTFTAPMNMS